MTMLESLEETYEKTKLHREKLKEFEKLFKPGVVDSRIILFGRRVVVFGSEYALGDCEFVVRLVKD